jgi:DNA-binding response OmpR family regulator
MPPEMIAYIPPKVKQVLVDLKALDHPAAHTAAEIIQAFVTQATPDNMPYVDLDTNTVVRGEVKIKLSPSQAVVLSMLVEAYPKMLNVKELRMGLYGPITTHNYNTVRVLTHGLRRKLGPIKTTIENVPWSGYRIALEPIYPLR